MMSLGEIVLVNEEAALRSLRAKLKPTLVSAQVLDQCRTVADLADRGVSWPYIGKRRVKGFQRVAGVELFVDKTGMDYSGRALSWHACVEEMRRLTQEHGALYWGVLEDGPFQAYLGAWKPVAKSRAADVPDYN